MVQSLEVKRWTHWDDRECEPADMKNFDRLVEAIKSSLKRNGYRFTGSYHQNGKHGVPVFNDGTKFEVSMRTWGRIMASALGNDGPMDYTEWAWELGQDQILPKEGR